MQGPQTTSIHHASRSDVEKMLASSPVFVLSTGRTGTKLVARLLDGSSRLIAQHEPRPTLMHLAHWASTHQHELASLVKVFEAARFEMLLEADLRGKIYAESNHCLTFFAPAIDALLPRSRFVHLVRHPGDFIASAARKGWHSNDSIWEAGRVRVDDPERWRAMDRVERLAWLWRSTNGFVGDFLSRIDPERGFVLRLEDIAERPGRLVELARFVGAADLDPKALRGLTAERVNELAVHPWEPPTMRKDPSFPRYRSWSATEKARLGALVGRLATDYGYVL
jgi:hypothetical protein